MTQIYRPLVQSGRARPKAAVPLAGGPLWFDQVEVIERGRPGHLIPARDLPSEAGARLSAARAPIAGLSFDVPRIMGILNVTPDSFSDGGQDASAADAATRARAMQEAGADLIDIGGESTRPGAEFVPEAEEIARVVPVIEAMHGAVTAPISVDTRKAGVARAACDAGAVLVNDISGFTFDPDLAPFCADRGVPVCVMHSQGDPSVMQESPRYDDVLLDVYQALESRVAQLESLGLSRDRILVDPGIGFGKTLAHNQALLAGIAAFHGLGCAVLLGVSRKRMIGTLGNAPDPALRAPGSIALGLRAVAEGVQILRVHDVAETRQALSLWQAVAQEGEQA